MSARANGVRAAIEAQGWTALGLFPSPILGGAGAREFLIGARHESVAIEEVSIVALDAHGHGLTASGAADLLVALARASAC